MIKDEIFLDSNWIYLLISCSNTDNHLFYNLEYLGIIGIVEFLEIKGTMRREIMVSLIKTWGKSNQETVLGEIEN